MSLRILTNFSRATKNRLVTHNFWTNIELSTRTDFTRFLRFHSTQNAAATAMRFIRFQRATDSKIRVGSLSDDGKSFVPLDSTLPNDIIEIIKSNVSAESIANAIKSGKWEPLTDDIKLLAPIDNPEKVICIGLNYLGHCKEQNKEAPKEPMFFSKYASAITGPTGDVILHEITSQLDWEVELAVIIGKQARKVSKANALDHVFGYSVAQDISARDWQKLRNGGQFLIGKSMDTFCPLGPAIVHKSHVPDPHNLQISCDINGVRKQNGNTNELIFRIDDIIHLLSQTITLKPGDVILTGTPSGVGMHRKPAEFLAAGDLIESEIESIGKIRNKVIADTV